MSKSQKFIVASLCLALLAGTGFAQKLTQLQVVQGDSAYIKGAKPMFAKGSISHMGIFRQSCSKIDPLAQN